MLGMKPQQLGEVASDLAPLATDGVHLLSILAGVSLADLAERFPQARAQVRILPNLAVRIGAGVSAVARLGDADRSEEHTSELQSLMRISYAVFCLKKKKKNRAMK